MLPIGFRISGHVFCIRRQCAHYHLPDEQAYWQACCPGVYEEEPLTPALQNIVYIYVDTGDNTTLCAHCSRELCPGKKERQHIKELLEGFRIKLELRKRATYSIQTWIDAVKERRIAARQACLNAAHDQYGPRALREWLESAISETKGPTEGAITRADLALLYRRYKKQAEELRERRQQTAATSTATSFTVSGNTILASSWAPISWGPDNNRTIIASLHNDAQAEAERQRRLLQETLGRYNEETALRAQLVSELLTPCEPDTDIPD